MEKRIYVQSIGVESWKEKLADPEKHWKKGYSARATAYCWESSDCYPDEIEHLLSDCEINKNKPLLVIPEYKVALPYGSRASQNDIFVLARTNNEVELAVIMVEAKVSEPFDRTINKWMDSDGKARRFSYLINKLEIETDPEGLGEYYYQLFHRTVSSVITAEEFCAKKAVMLVHSFNPDDKWFEEYKQFVNLLNSEISAEVNKIYKIKTLQSGIDLYIGWAKGSCDFLNM